jgi:hypothetical protein
VNIDCPQDTIIIKLNADLNKTYLWYGAAHVRGRYEANQAAQDSNAARSGSEAITTRIGAKAGSAYFNRNRDLVDTIAEDKEILSKVKDDELPDALKPLKPEEREAYVRKMASRRAEIQKQINALAAEREKYVAKERKRLAGEAGGATFGDATVAAIRKQLSKSGFENVDDAARAN